MSASSRWQRERAAWLKVRAGSRPARRRRAEQLALAARHRNRQEIVAGDSPFGEVTTRSAWHRSIYREEGSMNTAGWFLWTLIWFSTVLLLFGPALLIGLVAYGVWWWQVPRWGRLRSWPYWAIATGVVGLAFLVDLIWPLSGWAIYAVIQTALGFIRAAWRVRAWGWPAVDRAAKAAATKVRAVAIADASDSSPNPVIEPVAVDVAPKPVEHEAATGIAPIEFEVVDEDAGLEDFDGDEPIFDDEPFVAPILEEKTND